MCNLYHLSPRDSVAIYFRALVPDYVPAAVGPFGSGLMLRAQADGALAGSLGQWGMIKPGSKTRRPTSRAILTNNARIEGIAERVTYRQAWERGQRCLIPAAWYQEPNWETGRNIWWRLQRADGAPWGIAGLWSEWVDPDTGEVVPNYTMVTVNCDDHPLLSRLHKPDDKLPADAQDKRSLVCLEPSQWDTWLNGDEGDARALLSPPATDVFDQGVTLHTDGLLARMKQEASEPSPNNPQLF
ncbi:Putative SOS response-associated peptidase [Rubrivivax sp. A210]|uniref:SOS response-associated peptidase n=1 Tax=Rubrivivax sp. A210 TaxID=2772301 RepID=UPI00191AAF57|nr:SOS response-associated peptidase family protein [Rubrivivax sp. A210]CAD5366669.1 Putative SOS response-associated peptidase [Rubrivivax sp. A210]